MSKYKPTVDELIAFGDESQDGDDEYYEYDGQEQHPSEWCNCWACMLKYRGYD